MVQNDQNIIRFRKELEKMFPLLELKIKELADKISALPSGDVNADQ